MGPQSRIKYYRARVHGFYKCYNPRTMLMDIGRQSEKVRASVAWSPVLSHLADSDGIRLQSVKGAAVLHVVAVFETPKNVLKCIF